MSSGGLNPRRPPPSVAQTKSSRLLAARRQQPSSISNPSSSVLSSRPTAIQTPVQNLNISSRSLQGQTSSSLRRPSFGYQNDSGYRSQAASGETSSATPRVSNRLSLPSIGLNGGPSGLSSRVSDLNGRRRRTNPSEEYFNDVGMVLESDDSPDITEWDYRVTPRNLNRANTPKSSSRNVSSRPKESNSSSSRGSTLFPISRNSLLTSRSSQSRPSLGRSIADDETPRNDQNLPASSEFSQVLSEIYSSSNDGRQTLSTSVSSAGSARSSQNNQNARRSTEASRVPPSVSSVETTNVSVASRTPLANNINTSNLAARAVAISQPLTDTSEFEVENVDDVLTRIRRQNNLPENATRPSNPENVPPRVASRASSNPVAESSNRNSVTNIGSLSNHSRTNRVAPSETPAQSQDLSVSAAPLTNGSLRSGGVSTATTTTVASSAVQNRTSPVSTPRPPPIPASRVSANPVPRITNVSSSESVNVNDNFRVPASPTSSLVSTSDAPNARTAQASSNTATSRDSSSDDSDSPDLDELRAILQTPPAQRTQERNRIFSQLDTSAVPPVRNTVNPGDDDDSGDSDTPRFVSSQRTGNRIGVRFTTSLRGFAAGRAGLRPSEHTNAIFSSDESEDDEPTARPTQRPPGDATPSDSIAHLDAHMGIMQLLGLDLPQSTTEVILLNQRSILEQLLETYITLMVSIQTAEPARPAGLAVAVIDGLPRESIIKQQVSENLSCSICLANFEFEESATKLPECTHLFHHPCITHWLQKSPTCPLCRTPVQESGTNSS